jgi:hypothetical protein
MGSKNAVRRGAQRRECWAIMAGRHLIWQHDVDKNEGKRSNRVAFMCHRERMVSASLCMDCGHLAECHAGGK